MAITRELDLISEGYVKVPDVATAQIGNKINDAARKLRSATVDVARYAADLLVEMDTNQGPRAAGWMNQAATKAAEATVELTMLLELAGFSLTKEEIELAYGPSDVYFTTTGPKNR